MQFRILLLSALAASIATALPQQVVSGDEVTGTQCLDTSIQFDTHSTNVAILGICGGIASSIQKCGGNPSSTTGQSGTSLFTLNATDAGSTINISKGRWERCVKAAQLTCPQGSFQTTCIGGATPSGDVSFSLTEA
ncbi:hypothetical protein BU26DRAFT_561321 [Trematosphaeria pertusa]|uniref:Uncharacterized protein n=1 Tax=Trematosphaeria pertusa TaxID=390896 RepID=A0A6A6IUG9_9PLEO|nr:uncharacterized protein BU26DRAFT_561321 [Trematosphaeria pertusa]KAF2254066.1 hypothetical protein BU26DRAFT_561321 [Trematosphaeria pertusa]